MLLGHALRRSYYAAQAHCLLKSNAREGLQLDRISLTGNVDSSTEEPWPCGKSGILLSRQPSSRGKERPENRESPHSHRLFDRGMGATCQEPSACNLKQRKDGGEPTPVAASRGLSVCVLGVGHE